MDEHKNNSEHLHETWIKMKAINIKKRIYTTFQSKIKVQALIWNGYTDYYTKYSFIIGAPQDQIITKDYIDTHSV